MLTVERKDGKIIFEDSDRAGFFTATIHQPEGSDGFEVNIKPQGKRRKNQSVFASRYLAPTLHAAGQIVTSEYHLADAAVDSADSTLVADFWLDQLDGGLRWRLQLEEDDDDDDDDDDDGPGEGRVLRMVGRLSRG